MTALQQIIKEAKAIRKKYPNKEWKECVAQASAIYASKHKGKSPVGKKKKIGYSINKTVFVDPMESGKKRKKKTNKYSVKRNASGEFVKFKKIGLVKKRKPTEKNVLTAIKKAEQVQKKHMKGIKVGMMPIFKDEQMAREIKLYSDNDSQLYFTRRKPILINLEKKYKKGTFNVDKAAKLWRYYIDAALMKYNKDFGSKGDKWYELLNVHDRNLLAQDYAMDTLEEFKSGNFYL